MTYEEVFKGRKKKIQKELVDATSILYTPQSSNKDMLFESIQMPHWSLFINMDDVMGLYKIATSASLAGNFQKKREMIDSIMYNRGFKFMAGGTNRMVYKHLEVPSIVAKVPIDRVGLSDNFCEMNNQKDLWPYCAKMIQVAPYGVVGFAERVDPILNRYQFNAFAPMIYMIILQIIGKYVMEDIGTDYFKNWGVRHGGNPVLLDYPYLFQLDGRKLICKNKLPNGQICGNEIDYSPGYNYLYCKGCGRKYNAAELQLDIQEAKIEIDNTTRGGKKPMKVKLVKGGTVLASSYDSDSICRPSSEKRQYPVKQSTGNTRAILCRGSKILSGESSTEIPVEKEIDDKTKEVIINLDHTIKYNDVSSSSMEETTDQQTEEVKNSSLASEIASDVVKKLLDAYPNGPSFIMQNPIPITEEKKPYPMNIVDEPSVESPNLVQSANEKEESIIVEKPVQHQTEEIKKREEENKPVTSSEGGRESPWVVPPSLDKKPVRRIITNSSSSGTVVQNRQKNPYK